MTEENRLSGGGALIFKRRNRRGPAVLSFALAAALSGLFCNSASAAVERDDASSIVEGVPTYCWQDTAQRPKAIAIAVHGLVMHGGVFDTMARRLAAEGIIVVAPDLRGFGRWSDANGNARGEEQLDYDRSYEDLVAIVKHTKEKHPTLPTFCIGESLGAVLALRIASEMPNSIDGIILSSPAIKRHSFVREIAEQAGPFLANPFRHVNLIPYIKRFASEDPKIIQGALADPLVRKRMTAFELLKTSNAIKPALGYADRVPSSMPVLIIQGSKDRMVRSNAVVLCLTHLKSLDQTVKWFSDRGHLLIETDLVRQDTLETVDGWLTGHAQVQTAQSVQARLLPAEMAATD